MTHNQHKNIWDHIYSNPLQDIPWEIERPPQDLIDALDKKLVTPGDALDIGCGTGNHCIFLAEQGFTVTGIDISSAALNIAKQKAAEKGVSVNFLQEDAISLSEKMQDSFDFILEYCVFHHIPFSDTVAHVHACQHLLRRHGKILLTCYAEDDEVAQGKNITPTKFGTEFYIRTVDEIREAFKSFKEVSYYRTKLGKRLHHVGHCFIFEKI
jgi:2-polyprenyl-3-methyl-5-hydroxy-6-metoxy-1,4-benzoquinol methylase